MPSGSAFEADLRAAREAAGHSLSDVQQQTRIPVDVLRRFEEGDLVNDPTYNEVYLQAFVKSYAKAVGLAPSAALQGYQAYRNGSYRGSLHPDYDGSSEPPPPTRPAPVNEPPATAEPDAPPAKTPPPASTSAAPAVEALRRAPDPSVRPTPSGPPKTLAQARVNRPAVPGARRSFDKNWTLILGLFAAFVVVLGLALWFLVFDGGGDPEPEPDTVAVGADADPVAVDSSGIGAGAAAGGPQLQFPLSVSVVAGGDGLQWFRVTQDDEDRAPFWIDQGATQTFQADSLLILWGEGNDGGSAYAFEETTVVLQGFRFTPQSGTTLRLDRQSGQRILDSLAAAGAGAATPASPASAGQ